MGKCEAGNLPNFYTQQFASGKVPGLEMYQLEIRGLEICQLQIQDLEICQV